MCVEKEINSNCGDLNFIGLKFSRVQSKRNSAESERNTHRRVGQTKTLTMNSVGQDGSSALSQQLPFVSDVISQHPSMPALDCFNTNIDL